MMMVQMKFLVASWLNSESMAAAGRWRYSCSATEIADLADMVLSFNGGAWGDVDGDGNLDYIFGSRYVQLQQEIHFRIMLSTDLLIKVEILPARQVMKHQLSILCKVNSVMIWI
jgi:hypothetical protein